MQYSFLSAAVMALISSVVAQTAGFDAITSPTQDQNIPAGSSFDIIWQPGTETGDITITLLQGATPSTLETGPVIAKSISNSLGKYTWTVPASSSFTTYGFEITLDSAPTTLQYSFPFHITGGTLSSASGSATGASTTTIKLSTGPSYTATTPSSTVATSTTSVPSSTKTEISTYTSSNSTASATVATSSSSNGTSGTTLTKLTSTTTGTKTSATVTGSSTSSSVTPASTNAAATHIAGSIAMVGGMVLALAL